MKTNLLQLNHQQPPLENSRNMASALCEPRFSKFRKTCPASKWNSRDTLRILQFQHRDLQGSFQPRIFSLKLKELIRKIVWLSYLGVKSQNCISINSMFLPQCWKTNFKTEVCSCSGCPTGAMLWVKRGRGVQISGRSCDVAVIQRA